MKLLKKITFILAASIVFAVAAALFLQNTSRRFFSRLESVTYDWRYRLKYPDTVDGTEFPYYGIHIVDIDERSMEKLGSYWNWDRGNQAQMINSLTRRFPASIAFDVLFYDHEDHRHKTRFLQILHSATQNDETLQEPALEFGERFAASINYDKQLEEAIRNSARVTLGIAFLEESDYLGITSQIAHRMNMEWHNSLNPASALELPDSLLRRIRDKKTIIDGIYPENAQAARNIGHLNIVDPSGVIRRTPMLYRFGDFSPIYLPISIRVAATLFGTPNEEIVFEPENYIDIGTPFKIFKEENGNVRFSYPDFTETQFRMIMADRDEIAALSEGQRKTVSSYMAIVLDDSARMRLETRSGRLPHELTTLLLPKYTDSTKIINDSIIHKIAQLAVDDETDIGGGFTAARDSETEWEIYSDNESVWLNAHDIKTLLSLMPEDLVLECGTSRKLLTFDYWIRRESGILVSSLPVLRAGTLSELLAGGAEILETIAPGSRRDFGKPAQIPIGRRNRHIVTYFGPKSKPFPYFSFYDIMKDNINFPLEGKVFIVGSTSPALFDIKPAPHDRNYPAVEIHASILNSIFTDSYVRRLTERQDLLLVILVGLIAAIIAFLTKPLLGVLLVGGSLFAYAFGAYHIFDTSLIWVEMVRPMIAIVLTFIAVMVYRYVTEEKNRKFLQNTFKQYLSPELIDMMYTNKQMPQLGGDEGVRTAFFTDIAGFSTFSEKLESPTRLVELLNEYLSAMTDILLARYGTLDKYIGDAIVAFFGAPVHQPDHAAQACYTALDMQKKLGELRGKWRSEGDKWPEIVHNMQMRIGINTGAITTGNMGSAVRMNYTMMGDSVNLAARIESAAKKYGVYTMISNYTYDMVKDKFEARKLDMITVVGKSEPVTVYELMERKGELTKELSGLLDIYNQGINYYYAREFDKALECFESASKLEPDHNASVTPSSRFVEMCKIYIDNPPGDDWDGVNRLTSK